jgi:hypothetical protein
MGIPEAERELETRLARLANLKECTPDRVNVANADACFVKAGNGKVLADAASNEEIDMLRKLCPPGCVMPGCIAVNGFLGTAMNRQIRLFIALNAKQTDRERT